MNKFQLSRLKRTGCSIEYPCERNITDEELYVKEASELSRRLNSGEITAEEYSENVLVLMDVYGKR